MIPNLKMTTQAIDHLLVIGFGGPPRPEDVKPFPEAVTRGLGIPAARLAEVARHYEETGGCSPYNAYASRLVERLAGRLGEMHVSVPLFLGMRNWHPLLSETMRAITRQGLQRGVGVILAPHRCDSSFEQYLKNVEDAKAEASAPDLHYEYLKPWHDHPLFIQAQADEVRKVFTRIEPPARSGVHLLFSAHSIPIEMARRSRYEEEVGASSRLVAEELQAASWSLAYQSRSGNPRQPWLEPDVPSALRQLKGQGKRDVLLVPIGFLSDHTEVLYDLDVEARREAERLGLRCVRASTVMDHPQFITMLAQLIEIPLLGRPWSVLQ
ncbi:MAG: ferrochelatase [Candidatus Omnitrophica bacterium]|nr:ferrochelatase [Candidatus Omnitrophota bacterium]